MSGRGVDREPAADGLEPVAHVAQPVRAVQLAGDKAGPVVADLELEAVGLAQRDADAGGGRSVLGRVLQRLGDRVVTAASTSCGCRVSPVMKMWTVSGVSAASVRSA